MIENIFTIIIISLISLIPIVIWGYIFSYIDSSYLSRKRFTVGLVGGMISVVPILFLDKLLESPGFSFLNIFEKVTQVSTFFGAIQFYLSLVLFLFILAGLAFIFISWTDKNKKMLKIYIKNIVIFSIFIFLITIFVGVFSFSGMGGMEITESVRFGDIAFNTLKLIIFYYILIAFIEEASKHFNFLQSSVLHIQTVQNGVLYAIFVALGFAFIENILYLHSLYLHSGFSMELASTYFYRSIFSVMVHVLCSAVVAYSFSKVFLLYKNQEFNSGYLKIFSLGLFIGILLHLIFDISLTLRLSFMIIIYFIGGYLYISSIFYKD